MSAHDVVIVGAGLAGLRAAIRLARAGRDVVVLEASDEVGGRERTDRVDGFLLDRGFHVLNPAYPAVRRWVDVTALAPRRFPVAVRVRREKRSVVLAHPLRHPGLLPATLTSGLLSPRDVLALARWTAPALAQPRRLVAGPDRTLGEAWDDLGFRGPLRREVLEPFLAGVIADDRGTTSDAFVRLLIRMFALGRPGLPAGGIGALPRWLADRARSAGADIRLGHRVLRHRRSPTGREVEVEGADSLQARAVVIAVGPDAVAGLTDLPAPPTRGLQTWWFETAAEPSSSAFLAVDGRRRGPIVNTAVISRSAPSYAPPGRHLVQTTCLLPRDEPAATEDRVRRQLRDLWGPDASEWRLLRRDDIRHALPAQRPPLQVRSASWIGDDLLVAGDHRDTASIQGALVSGDRVARALLRSSRP